MGCDIHTRIEYLSIDGKWLDGNLYRINPYYNAKDPYECDPYMVVGVCDGRNYELFATLANVRNYGDHPYIEDPRGLPDDACARTRKDYDAWGEDAHSASYFTLKELMDWRAKAPSKIKRSGMMPPDEAAKVDAGGEPRFWCGYTSDKSYVYREWEVQYNPLDDMIEALIRRGEDLWLWFSQERAEQEADKLRIVFWFDN